LEQALDTAEDLFIFFPDSETNLDLIDEYLNGPRTLSDDRLSSLFVKCTQGEHNDTLEIMLAATHFLGDGMALHTFMNEFYTLLGSIKTIFDIKEMIEESLDMEYHPLPSSLEDQLSPPASSMARVVGAEEYQRSEARNIGGQTFPVSKIKKERKTSVPTFAYTQEETQLILKKCKANGVTIAHAVFALCNVAWARRAKSTLEPWSVPTLHTDVTCIDVSLLQSHLLGVESPSTHEADYTPYVLFPPLGRILQHHPTLTASLFHHWIRVILASSKIDEASNDQDRQISVHSLEVYGNE
jgi:hypothetical protein